METLTLSRIPSYNWNLIESKAKKLSKYGVTATLDEIYVDDKNQELITISLAFPPTLESGSFEFVGIKKQIENSCLCFGNIPAEFKNDSFFCDHCRSDRERKSVVIIKNKDTGEYKQLGKSCVKKYLNRSLSFFGNLLLSIEEIIENINHKQDQDEFFEDACRLSSKYYDTTKFLYTAYLSIKKRGYIKTNSDGRDPQNKAKTTFEDVTDCINDVKDVDAEIVKKCKKTYIDFVNKKGKDSFSENVINLLNTKYFEKKYSRMLVFVPLFFLNACKYEEEKRAKEEKRKEFNKQIKNEYVGKVKDKISITCKLLNVANFETCYGGVVRYTNIYTFISADGHLLQWHTQKSLSDYDVYCDKRGDTIFDIDEQKKINIKLSGTVKDLKEYKDNKYTVLTRCKIETV